MRLRWGPYATLRAEQVLFLDPLYVVGVLNTCPVGALTGVFQDLIGRFDARPFTLPCARCLRTADGVCAYPGSVELIGFCARCVEVSPIARPSPAHDVSSYEDALRHVATGFRRGHRAQMRRIAKRLLVAKGGLSRLSEAEVTRFMLGPVAPTPAVDRLGDLAPAPAPRAWRRLAG